MNKRKSKEWYMVVENIKDGYEFKINVLKNDRHEDSYIRFYKKELKQNISKSLFNKLLKNGLYKSKDAGKTLKNSLCSMHRLVASLYYDCTEKEVHHIDKNPENNEITNLIPVNEDTHCLLDKDIIPNKIKSHKIQNDYIQNTFKFRNVITNNENLIKDILIFKEKGFNKEQIHRKIKSKIKSKRTLHEILKLYFYSNKFLKHLEFNELQELKCKFSNIWKKITIFDYIINKVIQGF